MNRMQVIVDLVDNLLTGSLSRLQKTQNLRGILALRYYQISPEELRERNPLAYSNRRPPSSKIVHRITYAVMTASCVVSAQRSYLEAFKLRMSVSVS